ncbi:MULTISPECIES: hypothetical protein [Streptomyces]|uniref:Uncharacterized protein n=1 Tax=Streptomyces sp. NBC_00093 TaxID=2975649 RepID=A0AAU2AEU2_9ACTN
MGTSLTPEFWERFAVLLVLAVGLTCVLVAVFDGLVDRLMRRRTPRTTPHVPHPSARRNHRTSVHS